MACTPLVLSPCADDNVSVANVLGAQGDVNFTEYGATPLTAGQTELEVTFDYQKESALYVFEYLYVKNTNDPPDAIIARPAAIVPVPYSQDTRKFKVVFWGPPIAAGDVLVWRVTIPDPLRTVCVGNGPQYSILLPSQQGVTPLIQGQDFINVAFETLHPDNDWAFEALSIENQTDPLLPSQCFSWTVALHAQTGFRLDLSGSPTNEFYVLRWKIRTTYPLQAVAPVVPSVDRDIPYILDSIADLRAMSTDNVSVDELAQTLGYFAPGDGGGNIFYWDAISAGVDNDGTIITPTDHPVDVGRWIAIYTGA